VSGVPVLVERVSIAPHANAENEGGDNDRKAAYVLMVVFPYAEVWLDRDFTETCPPSGNSTLPEPVSGRVFEHPARPIGEPRRPKQIIRPIVENETTLFFIRRMVGTFGTPLRRLADWPCWMFKTRPETVQVRSNYHWADTSQ